MKSIVIIGSGNVATCFGHAFKSAGLNITAVFSPDAAHAKTLGEKLHTEIVSEYSEIPDNSDFYLLAVKDSVINEVSDNLKVNGIVIHCSGITEIDALNKHKSHGVIWPVQTITKDHLLNKDELPLCVEGNNGHTQNETENLARMISNQVIIMNGTERKYAHLAAVITNNMSNHLFDVASQILKEHNLSFDILRPIISETARKVQHALPHDVQTGPAKRNDIETIQKHLGLLKDHPDFARIYEAITASIRNKN